MADKCIKLLEKLHKMSYKELLKYCKQNNGPVTYAYNMRESRPNFQRHHDLEINTSHGYVGYETEKPENLTWADLIEHLFLHLKISEKGRSDSSDPTLAVYRIYGKLLYDIDPKRANPNIEAQMFYREKYHLVLNFANDSYQWLEKLVKKFTENRTTNLTHNASAFSQLLDLYQSERRAYVKISTGGGKTPFGLSVAKALDVNAFVLCPQKIIKDGWQRVITKGDSRYDEHFDGRLFIDTYQKTNFTEYADFDKFICDNNIKLIICDEAHHVLNNLWGKNIKRTLEAYSDIKLLGLTATDELSEVDSKPHKQQFNDIFKNKIEGISLEQGIQDGVIWPIEYKIGLLDSSIREKQLEQLNRYLKFRDIPQEIKDAKVIKVKASLSNMPSMEEALEKSLCKDRPLKAICFADSLRILSDRETQVMTIINRIFDNNPEFKKLNEGFKVYEMYSAYDRKTEDKKLGTKDNDETAKAFNDATCGILFVKDMAKEGFHPDGINTLIMLRSTQSQILYKQQLGRVVRLIKNSINPHCQVFDFVDNFNQVQLIEMRDYLRAVREAKKDFERRKRALSKLGITEAEKTEEEKLKAEIDSCVDVIIGIEDIYRYQATIKEIKELNKAYGYRSASLPIGSINDPNNLILKSVGIDF